MLYFIQVRRTFFVKGVQIYSVETKAWRVSVHFITHYQIVWLFFLVLCDISPHQGSIESKKIHPKSPRNQWTPFFQLTFSSFHFMFQSFFSPKGLFTIKHFWPKTAKRPFSFSQKPVFRSASGRFSREAGQEPFKPVSPARISTVTLRFQSSLKTFFLMLAAIPRKLCLKIKFNGKGLTPRALLEVPCE